LKELQRLLTHALKKTEALWPALEKAYALIHQAAHLLANHDEQSGHTVRERYEAFLLTMKEQQASLGLFLSRKKGAICYSKREPVR